MTRASARPGRIGPFLWVAAAVVMLGTATWQRMTGPTYPRRGAARIAGQEVRWSLPRSGTSGEPLRVAVAVPAVEAEPEHAWAPTGTIHYRRFPTEDPFERRPLLHEGVQLVGSLPAQPPAGKLEYFVTVDLPGGEARIPDGEPVVMRFKGHVPIGILLPHVVTMFFAMLIGVRAALAAALARPEMRRTAWIALLGITIGGMILGPIVQKHAFDAYWTGWPRGGDLTDNKTAVMWLAWIAAVAFRRGRGPRDRPARAGVVLAAIVMLAVYVIPHSLRGSELDYSAVERGGPAVESTDVGR